MRRKGNFFLLLIFFQFSFKFIVFFRSCFFCSLPFSDKAEALSCLPKKKRHWWFLAVLRLTKQKRLKLRRQFKYQKVVVGEIAIYIWKEKCDNLIMWGKLEILMNQSKFKVSFKLNRSENNLTDFLKHLDGYKLENFSFTSTHSYAHIDTMHIRSLFNPYCCAALLSN